MVRIGITGNIGSGKSTVALVFEALGIPVYFADKEAAALMTLPEIKQKIIAATHNQIYNGDVLNKTALAEAMFNNDALRLQINAIVHPAVTQHFEIWFSQQHAPYVLKEAALLFEAQSHALLDKIICVHAPSHIRLQRVMQRDNRTEQMVKAIEAKQMPEAEKMRRSDYLIQNYQQAIIPQVLNIHQKILKRGFDLIKDNT
ncbi:MAG: dephospho-CoA kinase [Bacteroidia bacterium]|nr:dephospho-CoA kinase [Bacteroidia bacterium]